MDDRPEMNEVCGRCGGCNRCSEGHYDEGWHEAHRYYGGVPDGCPLISGEEVSDDEG